VFGDNLTYLRTPCWLPREEGTVVVTGGDSGFGREVVHQMASLGYRVIFTAQEEEKGRQTLQAIRDETGNPNLEVSTVDFASLKSVRAFAQGLKERGVAIHVLVNAAGGMFTERVLTSDGLEAAFQVNYLSHFLLTTSLVDNLSKASPPARVINTSSLFHWLGGVRLDDLQHKRWYLPPLAYADSRLASILFTRELQRKFTESGNTGIRVVAAHPGPVDAVLPRFSDVYTRMLSSLSIKKIPWTSRTHLYACLAPQEKLSPGAYYAETRRMPVSFAAKDPELGAKFWAESEKILRQADGRYKSAF